TCLKELKEIHAHELAKKHSWGVTDGHKITPHDEPKVRAHELAEKHGWDTADAHKIWYFGADTTKAVQHLIEIKDSCITASQLAAKEGPAAEKPLRGCHCNSLNAALHADAIHHSGGQIILTCHHASYASVLTATFGLQEPVCLANIQCLESGKIYETFRDWILTRITPIPPKGAPRFASPYKTEKTIKGGTHALCTEGSELLLRPYAALQLLAQDQGPTGDRNLHKGNSTHTPTTIEAGVSYHQTHWRGYPANKGMRETKEAPQDLPTLMTPDTWTITYTLEHISMHMPHAQSL
ncbi:translation elongation factor 2, partial [Spiromyces aspiralis]